MRKSESIFRLEEAGLNTLDYFITKERSEVLHYLAKHSEDSISLRTERGDEFQCPYYYNTLGEAIRPYALKHLEEGYTLIFAPSLNIKDCEAFGTVAIGESGDDVIEVVFGQGKVRDLWTHPEKRTMIIPKGRMKAICAGEHELIDERIILLNTIYAKVKEKLYEDIPFVIEWSWYNRKVGRLFTQEIFWEVRSYV